MLDSKLAKIKELITLKEKVDTELAQLLGETEKGKRGRPKKDSPTEAGESQGGTTAG